jgi:hypothetical protein
MDEGEPEFQLLTEEEISAVIFLYLFSSAQPNFFFNLHIGGWNQGPLDTAAT